MGCIVCDEGAVCEAIVSSTMQKNWRSALPGSLVNAINDLSFQCFFKMQAVPSSVIQKMCNRRSVFLAKEFGIDDFPPISQHKDRVG